MAPSATPTPTHEYASLDLNDKSLSINHKRNHGKEYGKHLTKDVFKERVGRIDTDICDAGEEDAFFVVDMGDVYRQHLRWKMNLKRVKPHYGESMYNSRSESMY